MKDRELIILLKDQLRLATEREGMHLEQLRKQDDQLQKQSFQIEELILQVKELTQTVKSLEESMTQKDSDISKLSSQNKGLSKILSNPSEKVTPPPEDRPKVPAPSERGNNNAKRKEHFELEEQIIEIHPSDPDFDPNKGRLLNYVDSIRYKYIPPRFIKYIYRQFNYLYNGTVIRGKAPSTPLLNSHYDASFFAGILQLRYIYSMPVERIVKMFAEQGFELNKSTAHGLLSKAAQLLAPLDQALRGAIHADSYLFMDETYHKVLVEEKNEKGKGVRKGYIWGVIADDQQLAHFIYENGSRSKDVFNRYLDSKYKGAVQTDGLVCYKELETDRYPHAIRIGCWQHCKRKFLDLDDPDSRKMVDLINQLYRIEHQMEATWNNTRKTKYRQLHGGRVIREIEQLIAQIQSNPQLIPKSPLYEAVNYLKKELPALKNYLLNARYAPDTNTIERYNRYISLSRKNSLFCGSHDGAKRMALFYSLACSCRLNGVNTNDYFTDLLNGLAKIPPNAPQEVFRKLLPDMWKKNVVE